MALPLRAPARWRRPAVRLCAAAFAALGGCSGEAGNGSEPYRFEGATMGTTYSVTVVDAPGHADARRALAADVHLAIDAVDHLMSTWKEDSEVSRFNRAAAGEAVATSTATLAVVETALEVAALSDGAFDPTVQPLVDLWGFGPERRRAGGTPAAAALEEARGRVGYRHVVVDAAAGTLRKLREGVELDLSAIAKGFAVDRAAEQLERLGYRRYLVEIGGELRAAGLNPQRLPWHLGIERPTLAAAPGEAVFETVLLQDRALATSGDYRNFREADGVRISHTLDPRSGAPIRHGLASVSVVGPDCMRCDALATAVNVLGTEAGLALIESRPGYEAYLVERDPNDGFRTRLSSGMERLLKR